MFGVFAQSTVSPKNFCKVFSFSEIIILSLSIITFHLSPPHQPTPLVNLRLSIMVDCNSHPSLPFPPLASYTSYVGLAGNVNHVSHPLIVYRSAQLITP